jgi:hypothetical protein
MSTSTPLIFRPSFAQRALAALLSAGIWVAGTLGVVRLAGNFPRLVNGLHLAAAAGEPTVHFWIAIIASLALCLVAGFVALCFAVTLVLVEGTHIMVDESGITVDHVGLPRTMAIRLGAGHLPWNHVKRLEKGKLFFILRGGPAQDEPASPLAEHYAKTTLKFLLVDELERLILIILERSRNLTFS